MKPSLSLVIAFNRYYDLANKKAESKIDSIPQNENTIKSIF
tara:strand:- start:1835 stop:1957 length:123 start_codon:yes stop_codon:yes gene_type:complete